MRKLIVSVGAVLAFALLACSGITDAIGNVVTTDQSEAAERGQAITTYTLPEGFSEQLAIGALGMEMVFIADRPISSEGGDDVQSLIMLAKFPEDVGNEADMREQARQALGEQIGGDLASLEVVETREIMVNGQPAVLTIEEGQGEQGRDVRVAYTFFDAKSGGPGMLMIYGTQADWDETAIDQFIDSLQ